MTKKKYKRASLHYMGSKEKLMPEIYRALKKHGLIVSKDTLIIDPFMGGGSVTQYFRSKGYKTFSGEYDERVVDLFHLIWSGERESELKEIAAGKKNIYYEDWASRDLIYFECGRHPRSDKTFIAAESRIRTEPRARARARAMLNIQKKGRFDLINESYDETIRQGLAAPALDHLIYCDPPYRGTAEYAKDGFAHTLFWQRLNALAESGVKIAVSEYIAPKGWVSIWEHDKATSVQGKAKENFNKEKLFVHESFLLNKETRGSGVIEKK